jgi:integrase
VVDYGQHNFKRQVVKKRAHGEGTLFQNKQGYWVAEVTLPNGKRKRKYARVQKDAKAWLLGQRKAISEAMWVESDSITVSAYLDRYMTDVGANTLRPKTIESYSSLIRLHVKPEIGNIRLTALSAAHLQHLYTAKLNEGLSRRTVRYIHSVLHKSLNQAMRWGLVVRNVCDLVDPPTPAKPNHSVWDVEQVKIFLRYTKNQRMHPVYVLAMTGMRLGELLGVRYEDVNWGGGTIHISHAVQYIHGHGIIDTEPKTDSAKRTIKLPAFVLKVLRNHVVQNRITEGLLFKTSNGTPFSPRNVQRYFYEAVKEAKLPRIRFHDLRHTAATLLFLAGTHPKLVQELLGHSSIALTLDTYSHVIPAMHGEAADKMDDMIQL